MKPVVPLARMTGENPLAEINDLINKYHIASTSLQNGINYHIRDPQLKMCMRQGVIGFMEGIKSQWYDEPKSDEHISTDEFIVILDHLAEAGTSFFSKGVKLTVEMGVDALSLYGGVMQVVGGAGLLATPAWPLGLVLIYQGVGNTGGGISTLVNMASGTDYDWNVTKKLDEIVLGKKNGAMTFDAIDLGASIKGLMRLEIKTNEFGMPVRKLWRKDPVNYIRGIKNMTKWGLRNELFGDAMTGYDYYQQGTKK